MTLEQLLHNQMLEAAECGLVSLPAGWQAMSQDERARRAALALVRIGEQADHGHRQALEFRLRHPLPGAARAPEHDPGPVVRPAIARRTLIYHCCALRANDDWLDNVRRLLEHWGIFGRRIIALAYGEGLHDPADVLHRIDRIHSGAVGEAQWICLPNDPQLRETASFLPLLIAAMSEREDEAIFYGHTKGNSTSENAEGARIWRDVMYQRLLGDWRRCMDELANFAAVGIHKMNWPPEAGSPYPSGLRHGSWMLAGTFLWFRADVIYRHPHWRHVPPDRYGAEAWLSGLLPSREARSVYQLWPENQCPTPSPYDPATYRRPEL